MITENVSTLKIHKLTKEQYERELAAGRLDENAIYLTPNDDSGDLDAINDALSSIQEELDDKADKATTLSGYGITDAYTKSQVDSTVSTLNTAIGEKADSSHTHTIANITNLQSSLDGKAASNHTHIYYGVCETAADTVAKTVTVPNFTLETGAMVIVKFDNENSIASPTLNVSGTGAKPIYRYGTTSASTGTSTTGWRAGAVQIFVYDGTGWVRDFWENTTYSNTGLGHGYTTCSTAAATAEKTASLSKYSLTTGGIVAVKFANDVPAGATLNINSKGAKAIYHNGAAIKAGIIKAGDTATFIYSSRYHLISIDRDTYTKAEIDEAINEKPSIVMHIWESGD